MMHYISSPHFTEYSQERLSARVPRRIEEPEGELSTWTTLPSAHRTSRRMRATISFDGLRRLFGGAPKVGHS